MVLAGALALSMAACSSDPEPTPEPEPTVEPTPEPVARSPLTGLEMPDGPPDNPVFVVKIENTAGGSPQYALDKADLVVQQLVEGGLTRLAALYWSELPTKVGHVRSMRTTDAGIAAPVGGQVVASGAAPKTYSVVDQAGISVFTEDKGAPGFSSDPAKSRPYNRLLDLTKIAAAAEKTEIVNPYLAWTEDDAEAPAGETRTVTTASVRFSNAVTTNFAFADGTWSRTNGYAAQGQDFKATTMIVVFAKVVNVTYGDGTTVPETVFEGSGKATILAGDQAREVTWSKDALDSTLTFADAAGNPVTIDPGKIWINLVPESGAVSLG